MQLRKVAQAVEERQAGIAPGDVYDPVHNVRMGVRYLARMVDDFGDEDLGLMAYNTGPTRLLSYLLAVGEIPDSLWSYVRKVRREERKIRREMLRVRVLVADAAR
jgi:soluble lytic murein transglycosylase-like protein